MNVSETHINKTGPSLKGGLAKHATANPIFALFAVQLRRFKK